MKIFFSLATVIEKCLFFFTPQPTGTSSALRQFGHNKLFISWKEAVPCKVSNMHCRSNFIIEEKACLWFMHMVSSASTCNALGDCAVIQVHLFICKMYSQVTGCTQSCSLKSWCGKGVCVNEREREFLYLIVFVKSKKLYLVNRDFSVRLHSSYDELHRWDGLESIKYHLYLNIKSDS